MSSIKNLEPRPLWNYFYEITQIPRPSKKESRIIRYMQEFGERHNLETIVDSTGNVIIRKPATKGMENRKGIVFQTHLDMVPQKNSDKQHDFENDPIEALIDGEWVKANGTTLGSDNGIGVAATMAVLASKDISHGPVEALFTVDEETGMSGVFGLRPGVLKGDILLNLDSEDEGELCVGCAGGIDVSARKDYKPEPPAKNMVAYKLTLKGLKGGHSGVDIALGRANSNKLLFRFLLMAESEFSARIAHAGGGDLRNAIPRESGAMIVVDADKSTDFELFVKDYERIFRAEFSDTEPDLTFTAQAAELPENIIPAADQYEIIRAVCVCPNEVIRMSQAVKGLVETSNNLAIVKCRDGRFEVHCLTRSSVDSAKEAAAKMIAATFQLINADVNLTGGYPGWKPNMDSAILKTMTTVYKKLFEKEATVKAIHAGLECGLIGGVYPNLDMISFGPTIKYPHSPDEKVHIPSVVKFWDYIVETLKNIPAK
jgi:dipeptidase D